MNESYRTLLGPGAAEWIVQKSRFIGQAAPVETEEEALDFIRRVREQTKDATHHCYAYIIGQNSGIMRYSDDGEPGGTAGLPMMEVLRKRGVVNAAAVVTRYFGGILLGAGGLVRAYSHACALGLDASQVIEMEPSVIYLCAVGYPLLDRVAYALQGLPVQVTDTSYTTEVGFTLTVRERDSAFVLDRLTQVTDAQWTAMEDRRCYQAWSAADLANGTQAKPG